MRIIFLAIGDEILRGESREANGAELADRLGRAGLRLWQMRVLPDDFAALAETLQRLRSEPTWVVCSGGLGPTDDDFTRAAIAAACGVPLYRDAQTAEVIAKRFEKLGRVMAPSNLRQADFPQGAQILANRFGTAPGFTLQDDRLAILCLPGVPREFAGLLDDHLLRLLADMSLGQPPRREVTFRLLGIAESEMQGVLSGLAHYGAARMRSLPAWPDIRLELSPRPDLPSMDAFDALLGEVQIALGPYIYSDRRQDTLAAATLRALSQRQATLAVAESCTGGLVGSMLTAVPGASQVLLLDAVTYANSAKVQVLGVPQGLIDQHGAVSPEVAEAMAVGARRVAGADVAVATSGIAGPDGGTPDKPVGTLCVAVAWAQGQVSRQLWLRGMERSRWQATAAAIALNWARRWALGLPPE